MEIVRLTGFGCALAIFVWCCSQSGDAQADAVGGGQQDVRLPDSQVDGVNVAECVQQFEEACEVEVGRVRAAPEGGEKPSAPSTLSLLTHGKLTATNKAGLRAGLDRSIVGVEKQIRKAASAATPDLEAEAKLGEILELRRAQRQMLEKDDYLLLEPGVVNELWPSSPRGFAIVTMETIQIGGRPFDVVFPVETAKFQGLKNATENRLIATGLTAHDAGFRFNGLPDDVRAAAIAMKDSDPMSMTRDAAKAASTLLRRATLGGMVVDVQRSIVVKK